MITNSLAMCVVLVAAGAGVYGQSRSKRVRQPREVVEAFRVCAEFRSLLAENLEFDRAFEATFVKDPIRRRQLAMSESKHGTRDLLQVETSIIVDIYKAQTQLRILALPFLFSTDEEVEVENMPASITAIFAREPPNDPANLKDFATQRKRDVADFRAHLDQLAANNPSVAKNIREYKAHLLTPLETPSRALKPITGYRGKVLRRNEKYYRVDDCAVIREGGQMKLIGYTFISMRG